MKKLLILLNVTLIVLFTSCDYILVSKTEIKALTVKVSEYSYFEGQKDAINGDIRIKLNSDSIYIWTKSCWNNGKTPIYNPTYLDSK